MKKIFFFFWCVVCAMLKAQPHSVPFVYQEISVYRMDSMKTLALAMQYGHSTIANPADWKKLETTHIIVGVDLVFTKQPIDSTIWKTPYNQLLQSRLKSLYAIAPELKENTSIPWRMFLQTQCVSKPCAQKLFHGFVLHIEPKITTEITPHNRPPANRLTSEGDTIKHFKLQYKNLELTKRVIASTVLLRDSIVVAVLDSHRWESMNIITDWTGSMYPYGAQVLRWYYRNIHTKSVRCITLFNDGDDWLVDNPLKRVKKIGKTEGIYHIMQPDSLPEVLEVMEECMMNGDGLEIEENDCEAILAAISECPDFKNIVLVADNTSPVRDLELMNKIKYPVHVILCGSHPKKILRDYVTLAWKTGGSIHSNLGSYTFQTPEEPLEFLTIGGVEFFFNTNDKYWDWKANHVKTW